MIERDSTVATCDKIIVQLGTGGCTQKAQPVQGVYP